MKLTKAQYALFLLFLEKYGIIKGGTGQFAHNAAPGGKAYEEIGDLGIGFYMWRDDCNEYQDNMSNNRVLLHRTGEKRLTNGT